MAASQVVVRILREFCERAERTCGMFAAVKHATGDPDLILALVFIVSNP
jgi:hypothetical protein